MQNKYLILLNDDPKFIPVSTFEEEKEFVENNLQAGYSEKEIYNISIDWKKRSITAYTYMGRIRDGKLNNSGN